MDTTSNPAEYQKLFLHKVQAMENLQPAERMFLRGGDMKLYELRVIAEPMLRLRGGGRKLRRVIDERQMVSAIQL